MSLPRLLCLALLSLALSACSPRQMIINGMADEIAGQGAAAEDDLELAREASAFYLKLSESLLRASPDHRRLAESVTAGFTQYAYAFVAFEAEQVEAKDVRRAQALRQRAARLYARAQGHGLAALERRYPGLRAELAGATGGRALAPEDAGLAYWTAAAWAGRISLSKDDPEAVANLPAAIRLATLAWQVAPDWGWGALASLMGTLEASRPGGSRTVALAYFDRALALAGDTAAGPHVAKAENIALPAGDRAAFEGLLQQALKIATARRDMQNEVMQARARWLQANIDDLF